MIPKFAPRLAIMFGIICLTGQVVFLKPALADQKLLELRDDYPKTNSFTINSKRYSLGSLDDYEKEYFNSPFLNDVYIIRGMVPIGGDLAADKSKFSVLEAVSGYGIFFKHYLSQFMLGLELLNAAYNVNNLPNFPNIKKISFHNENLYLMYVIELGRLVITPVSLALGTHYGRGKISCYEKSCEAFYPNYNQVENEIYGYNAHLGIQFLWIFELNFGISVFEKSTFVLKAADGSSDFEFEAGNSLYYSGLSIRF